MRGVRTRKRAQEEEKEEQRVALGMKKKEKEQKVMEEVEDDDALPDDDDFNRMFDDKFDVFNLQQQQSTINNESNADDAKNEDDDDDGVVDGCGNVKSSGGGLVKTEVTSKELPRMKENEKDDDVMMMDQTTTDVMQNPVHAADDPTVPVPKVKNLPAVTSAGMSPPRAVSSSRNETPRFRAPRSFHEAQVMKAPPPLVSTDGSIRKEPEQQHQEQHQEEQGVPETPVPVNAEVKPPVEQTTDIPTNRHVARLPQQSPPAPATRMVSPPPPPLLPPNVQEPTAKLPAARELIPRTEDDDPREQFPAAIPPRKSARPRRLPAAPIFGHRPRGIDSMSTDDETSTERLTGSGGDTGTGSGHPARRCDEPRPWQTSGVPFDAWLEQDRKDFEAECALIQNLNAKVDGLRTELEGKLDDLSEMRVAVAVFVQRVNHIVNATEYQQVISEARHVAKHVTGVANDATHGIRMETDERAMCTSI